MAFIGITLRVENIESYEERRDCLDQRFPLLIDQLGYTPLLIPNSTRIFKKYTDEINFDGFLLSSGNDLVILGGDAPERDETEFQVLRFAIDNSIPILGICRGMQFILTSYQASLKKIDNHVANTHNVMMEGQKRTVNSFHEFGFYEVPSDFEPIAIADDGTIEAVRHRSLNLAAIMWHPERNIPFLLEDLKFIKNFFRS